MDSGFKMELILEYSKIFDDEPKLEDLLSGIGRNTLRKIAVFFLGFDNQNSKFHDPIEFIEMLFCKENIGFVNDVCDKVKAYQNTTQAKIIIPYTLTSLTLFEYAFQHLGENETLTQVEIEVNVFKACLLINEVHTIKAHKAFDTVKSIKEDNYLSELIFTMSYADSDLINFDPYQILTAQIVKSIMLFEMLEQDGKATQLLKAFLDYFECANWKDYLKAVLPVALQCIQKRNEAHIDILIEENEHTEQSIRFFDKLIISDTEELIEHDFTSVRANPIYQVDELTYRVVFPLFAMEMLHKGLYFKLAAINNSLEDGQISNLKGYYGENFSENYLLYETMQRMYGKSYKKYTGEEMKASGLVGEPDYYLRNGNKIFLFESKDVFIRADIKASFDYTQLEQALKEKFYFVDKGKGKIKKKAILQILFSVKNTLDRTMIVDVDYSEKRVVIYPILVTHHHQFDVSGLNNILKEWFKDELGKLGGEGYDVSRVTPLTVINIDDLLYYQDLFRNKQITLEELIDGYHEHTTFNKKKQYRNRAEIDEEVQATLIPFSTYATKYIGSKQLKIHPNILKEKGFSLFD